VPYGDLPFVAMHNLAEYVDMRTGGFGAAQQAFRRNRRPFPTVSIVDTTTPALLP
jgi:hypothetical protein